ncbi:MAG: protein translocase subunit SecF [Firmicutes bacterium]|nr:protein translocase subunit SecF [Bacillota bacterium]
MKIIENRRTYFIISAVVIAAGLISLIFRGLNFDIEFAGGTILQLEMHQKVEDHSRLEQIVKEVSGDTNPQIQSISGNGGDTQIQIKVKEIPAETITALYEAVASEYGLDMENKADLLEQSSISPIISSEMKRAAIISSIVAGILMLIYITVRFRDICFGLGALIPLIHDCLVVLAMYTILQIPVNNTFIVALLTIVGYSINNTIVVFDRIRENRPVYRSYQTAALCDDSIMQTLGRSLGTSFTTIVMILLLYILGVQSLRWFALPLLVGMIAGTYSSLFIASPVWYMLEEKLHKNER